MNIEIIAEESTRRATLDSFLDLPKLFPDELGIELEVSDKRFALSKESIISLRDLDITKQIPDAVYCGSLLFYNIAQKIDFGESHGRLRLFVVHQNYIWMDQNRGSFPEIVGDHNGKKVYSGTAYARGRYAIIGVPNESCQNNLKVAAHEIAHLLLDLKFPEPQVELKAPNHCEGYIDVRRCLMHTPPDITEKTLKDIALGFCNPCYSKLQNLVHSI